MNGLERQKFGLSIRSTMIYERSLELSSKICWKPEDLGLTRVHVYDGQAYKSKSELDRHLKTQSDQSSSGRSYFDWVEPLSDMAGIARETYLRETHWSNREQIVNVLWDTASQAYLDEMRMLLKRLTGASFDHADLVKFDTTNNARQFVGDPDSVYIDLTNKTIALIEIKIGQSTTKYSLDQCLKYQTLETFITSEWFFPGFKVCKLLFAPSRVFSTNAFKFKQLGPSQLEEGKISFSFEPDALAALKPQGNLDASTLLAARMRLLTKGLWTDPGNLNDTNPEIYFYSWDSVVKQTPEGKLRSNLNALMKYLAPSGSGG